jgi:hypothetical protein
MNPIEERVLKQTPGGLKVLVCCGVLLCTAPSAWAGWMDSLLGKSSATTEQQAAPGQRLWRLAEFTRIELVPREAGAVENQQPAQIPPDALRQQLMRVQSVAQGGGRQPLFGADELAALIGPLAQALSRAGPGDDVLLLSSSRRDEGLLFPAKAITARLFVQGDGLQLIVHDARLDFYDKYRGTNAAPQFTFGSRSSAGGATLESAGASNRRSDWLSIPMRAEASVASPAATPAAVTPAPMPAAATPTPMPTAATATPTAPPPKTQDGADSIERRLETLKRLRDRGLISEDEYQQKRKEILQSL